MIVPMGLGTRLPLLHSSAHVWPCAFFSDPMAHFSKIRTYLSVVDPDFELRRRGGGGGGAAFVLLALPAFLPSVISSFFT